MGDFGWSFFGGKAYPKTIIIFLGHGSLIVVSLKLYARCYRVPSVILATILAFRHLPLLGAGPVVGPGDAALPAEESSLKSRKKIR